jgi:hypothetical protein
VFHFRGHDSNVRSLAFAPDGTKLASGLLNSSVLVWDAALLARLPAPAANDRSAEELDRCWADLASEDAARADESIGELAASPGQAVVLLKARLQPAQAAAAERVRRLIADLDSEEFAVRETASRELGQLGDQAGPALRRALAANPSVELRRRLEPLLESLHTLRSPEAMRQVRAVQVLEFVSTPEARQVLEVLAKGAPGARLTNEATASLERLAKRRATAP